MQAARDKHEEEQVSLDVLKQVWLPFLHLTRTFVSFVNRQDERVNVTVSPMFIFLLRDGKSQTKIISSVHKNTYATHRHCCFTTIVT